MKQKYSKFSQVSILHLTSLMPRLVSYDLKNIRMNINNSNFMFNILWMLFQSSLNK